MRTVMILMVVLLVLGGGGYFGGQQIMAGNSATGSPSVSGGLDGQPRYVELDPLTAPFVRDGKFAQYVVLVVNLEVSDDDDVLKVRKFLPRLRDGFVTELHTLATMRNPEQKVLNLVRVKSRLLASADEVLGEGVVRGVLVQLAQ